MYVKKNLKLWLAVFALALPMMFVGTASAFFAPDGSKMVPAGGWDITDKGVCVTGVKSDGTIVTNSATSNPDCIATVVSSLTGTFCTGDSDVNGGGHYWTSTCVASDGTVISLKDLDRTATNCNKRAIAMGKTSGAMTSKCTAAWQYTGAAGDGAPGFAYTAVRVTSAYADSASCLAAGSLIGYSWATGDDNGVATAKGCVYAYGIAGTANKTLKTMATTTSYTGGNSVDFSALTQGQAMYNGVSWSTGVAKGGTASVGGATIATPLTLGGRAGCLECHNSTSQRNGYAERWKDTYLKTGHKNMLRKVTAGTNLIGPDGAVYTTDGTGAIDFAAGTYTAATGTTAGVAKQLFYIYGDWMAANPTVVYNNSLTDTLATNGYSCAACHTTGYANSTAGVCTDSSKTTAAACVSPATWVASVGIEGANGAEPQASYPGIKSITGTWQKDGITCVRCHNTTFPAITSTNTSTMMRIQETTGGHNNADIIVSSNVTNLCYGCHQSPAKGVNGGAAVQLDHPEWIPVKNTSTAISSANPGGFAPEWNGHVLGNSFLNSAHGKFTGTIAPNKVGKYNLDSGTYASTFKGKYCRSSSTGGATGGGSILKTYVNASTGAAEVIKGSTDCTTAGGYWKDAGTTAQGSQGSCTTCHDVHQSMVADVNAEEPLVKECTTCHMDADNSEGYGATQIAGINHPSGPGTPVGISSDSCAVCHMPKATSGGFPQHLWRINTSVAYSSFPTKTAFYGGSCSVNATSAASLSSAGCTTTANGGGGVWTAATKDLNGQKAADGSYANAVWVDLDHACGQCHFANGVERADADVAANAQIRSKATLASWANGIHGTSTPVVNNTPVVGTFGSAGNMTLVGLTASFTDDSTDADIASGQTVTVTVNWGDGTVNNKAVGSAFTHTYVRGGTFHVTYSVYDGQASAQRKFDITVAPVSSNVTGTTTPGKAVVRLAKNGRTIRTTMSDTAGAYTFTKVTAGAYTVKATKTGYTSPAAVAFTAPGTVSLITLTKK